MQTRFHRNSSRFYSIILVWIGIIAASLVKKAFTEESRLKDVAGESFEHLSNKDRRHLFVG